MIPPPNARTYESEIATYWLEDGLLISRSKSPRRTIENITGNVALVKHIRQPTHAAAHLSFEFPGTG